MIPKIIHYCWFGNKIPQNQLEIIENWKELHPDFEFMEWGNELIVDCKIKFLKQASRKKQWAFVADYFRLVKVYEFGGYYLDTDMHLIKRIDFFSAKDFVICEEDIGRHGWAFFGSIAKNPFLKSCIDKYSNIYFDQFKPPVIPYFLKEITLNYLNENNFTVNLTHEYFYPMHFNESKEDFAEFIKDETIGVHLWDFSWGHNQRNKNIYFEILYRLKMLIIDLFYFDYPLFYFKINYLRIMRLLKQIHIKS